MLTLRAARPEDHTDISVLLVSAFGQPNEHKLVMNLRASGQMAIELVTYDEHGLVGHICLSRFDAPQNWLALAPVAVRQEDQRKGIGAELISHALDQARQKRFSAVVVVGEPAYYKRFGFIFGGAFDLMSPYPKQYTGLFPIAPETSKAQVRLVYPEPFETV
jgi:putative acetyltransferase